MPWAGGLNDDGWPAGDGGGPNTSFMQETGVNDLPGDPASPEVAQQADDDYYWAGVYSTVIDGNGDYEPVGLVEANEEAAERAFAGIDNDLRYHFNLPSSLQSTDQLSISYDALNLHGGQADSRYGIEVYVNNVQVQPEIVIREAQLGETYTTEPFSLADVNAEVGSGYDNIITLKGVNYNAEGGGNWMGIDYVKLSQAAAPAPALATDKASYMSGDDITVNFSNGLGNPKDWVGLYRPDMTPGDVGSLKWSYVSGTTTAGEGLTDGAIVFAGGLPAGSYVARFFENDGYTQIADAAAFTVIDPPGVSTSKDKYTPGESITVNFSAGPGNPKDWIGLYRPDMTPGDVGSLVWSYVSGTTTAGDGLTDGSVTFANGMAVGDYKLSLIHI